MTGRGIYDHGDILRHSKIRIKNPENEVIATYCVRGFKKTKVGYYILRSIGIHCQLSSLFFFTEFCSLLSLSVLTNMITSIFFIRNLCKNLREGRGWKVVRYGTGTYHYQTDFFSSKDHPSALLPPQTIIFIRNLCCGSVIYPGSDFLHPGSRIPDPGLRRSRITDPGSASKNLSSFNPF